MQAGKAASIFTSTASQGRCAGRHARMRTQCSALAWRSERRSSQQVATAAAPDACAAVAPAVSHAAHSLHQNNPVRTQPSTPRLRSGQETTIFTAITQLAHHGMIYVPTGYGSGPAMFDLSAAKVRRLSRLGVCADLRALSCTTACQRAL